METNSGINVNTATCLTDRQAIEKKIYQMRKTQLRIQNGTLLFGGAFDTGYSSIMEDGIAAASKPGWFVITAMATGASGWYWLSAFWSFSTCR